MKTRHRLTLLRENHKHDGLGAVFLGVVEDVDQVREAVGKLLPRGVKVTSVEIEADRIRIEVECTRFVEEAQNLVRLGKSMLERGRARPAIELADEALRLDPLNGECLKVRAQAALAANDTHGAEDAWIRASEVLGYDGDILRGLANVALASNRRPTAMRYLEQAVALNPGDDTSRRTLEELRRQIEIHFQERGPKTD